MAIIGAGLLKKRPDLLPSIGIAFSSCLWGLFWIPVRAIEGVGISAAWTGPVMFLCVVVVFSPIAIWRWRNFLKGDSGFWIACGLSGITFTLYATSFHLTDVIHAMLLFYMSPIWSTILGTLFLGERLTFNRIAAISLGIGGLCVVLNVADGFPWPRNIGDWFALASGFCWSIASVRFFQGGAVLLVEKTFTFAVCALIASLCLVALPFDIPDLVPTVSQVRDAGLWLAIVTVFLLPGLYLSVWPATVLSPARVGVLFMFEAIAGVISAAVLTDEPYGGREVLGTLLILSAGVVELLRPQALEPGVSGKPRSDT